MTARHEFGSRAVGNDRHRRRARRKRQGRKTILRAEPLKAPKVMAATYFGAGRDRLLASGFMIDAIATTALLTLVNQVSGTPYRTGGDSPSGTDCSGLASW